MPIPIKAAPLKVLRHRRSRISRSQSRPKDRGSVPSKVHQRSLVTAPYKMWGGQSCPQPAFSRQFDL
jgi:hypothetical protein